MGVGEMPGVALAISVGVAVGASVAVAVGTGVSVVVGAVLGEAVAVGGDAGVRVCRASGEPEDTGSCQLHAARKTETRSANLVRELQIID